MKANRLKGTRIVVASLFALVCFGVGYITPHRQVALAQASSPHRIMGDSVPGGFHALGQVTLSTAQAPNGVTNWSPCAVVGGTCTVEVYFLTAPTASPTPQPSPCPSGDSCIQFTGTNTMGVNDPSVSPTTAPRWVAGTIVISPASQSAK